MARNLACDWHEIWHASYLYPSDIVTFVIFWQVIRWRLGRVPLTLEIEVLCEVLVAQLGL